MNILSVSDDDFDIYGDWLKGDVALKFINGNFTHIECEDGSIIETEVFGHMVAIGEQIKPPNDS